MASAAAGLYRALEFGESGDVVSDVVIKDESRSSELIRKVPHIVMTGLSLSCNPLSGWVTSGTWQVFSSFLVQDISFVVSATSSIAFAATAVSAVSIVSASVVVVVVFFLSPSVLTATVVTVLFSVPLHNPIRNRSHIRRSLLGESSVGGNLPVPPTVRAMVVRHSAHSASTGVKYFDEKQESEI
jgi:hypothetical protein